MVRAGASWKGRQQVSQEERTLGCSPQQPSQEAGQALLTSKHAQAFAVGLHSLAGDHLALDLTVWQRGMTGKMGTAPTGQRWGPTPYSPLPSSGRAQEQQRGAVLEVWQRRGRAGHAVGEGKDGGWPWHRGPGASGWAHLPPLSERAAIEDREPGWGFGAPPSPQMCRPHKCPPCMGARKVCFSFNVF